MKETGIIRYIDDLGRVVIPKELRVRYQMEEGTPVEFFTKGDEVILKKASLNTCKECGQIIDDNDNFCRKCGKEL